MPKRLEIESKEETLPRLIQRGESASLFLTSDAFRHRRPSDVSEARSEASWLRAGSALRIKMAGHPSKWSSPRTFATEGSERAPLADERGALITFMAEGWEHAPHQDGKPPE